MTHRTIPQRLRHIPMSVIPSVGAIVLSVALAGPAQAASIYNVSEPVSGTVYNPCNGELVAFTGTFHNTFNLTFDNNGGVHVDEHGNAQGITGQGDEGNTYSGSEADNLSYNAQVGQEETSTSTFKEVSHGSAPNFTVQSVFHVTVNANGTVTAFHDNFTATCNG